MDDQSERSYYEIALTNTQVLVAFTMLLVCVVGAFVAGMWVARKSFEKARVEVAAESAGAEETAAADDTFEFFEPEGQEAGAGPADAQEEAPVRLPQLPAPAAESDAPPTRAETERPGPETSPPSARPTPPAAEQPAAPALVIQVFSSRDEAQAQRLIEQLRDAGFPAFLAPDTLGGQPIYRVRVGPYADRGRAEAQAERLKREHRLDTWITTSPTTP